MEAINTHVIRQQQFTELYQQISSSYEALKTAYAEQSSELKKSKLAVIDYKNQAHYWEAQFKRIQTREEGLNQELEELKAKLRKREQQLFGRRTEKQASTLQSAPAKSAKKRGQQANNPIPTRRDYSDLPEVEEVVELTESENYCPCCHLPYEALQTTEDSEVLEIINVQAYRRCVRRKRYKRSCRCKTNPDPQIITVPPMERVFPKSRLGVSIWAHILIQKYEYQNPLNRVLSNLSLCNLPLSTGTVTGGLNQLLRLFLPIYDAIVAYNLAATHWHADETGWKVFEKIDGKESSRWYLWIFQNKESVVYKICPSRSSQVLKEHFGHEHNGGILNVDRYGAYKVIAQSGVFILAFCWAHVRRDFLEHAKGYPSHEEWGLQWVENIGQLYHLNKQRMMHPWQSKKFQEQDRFLRNALKHMEEKIHGELAQPDLLCSAKKILKSLLGHWAGLIVFVDYPDVPMDNNVAERGLRSSVVGRKNYYGSGAVWSGQLAAMMFTLLKTVKLWGINPHTWLLAYLQECAMRGGSPPDNVSPFLPWLMKPSLLELFAQPPKYERTTPA